MVKYSHNNLDTTFAALSDPIRRAMLERLSTGEKSVSDLARPFPVSMPAILKHLSYLQNAGLVVGAKKGRVRLFQLVAAPMQDAAEWISQYRQFWHSQFDSLEKYLDTQSEESSWKLENQNKKRRSKSNASSTQREKESTKHGHKPKN